MSYNVANLNTKLKFGNFYTYINTFDIFFLHETHVLNEKQSKFAPFFKDYVLCWVDAFKNNVMGRAIGGGLYGFKKTLQKRLSLKFFETSSGVTLFCKFNDVGFHFIPSYLNGSNWTRDFEKLKNTVNNLQEFPYCILGDLNARVSASQILDKETVINTPTINKIRRSKDLILDNKGKQLLSFLEDCGGVIINGRMSGDRDGEKTFCGVMGSSVIDYCICSYNLLKLITDFHIPSKPFSDHMPLVVSLRVQGSALSREIVLPPKIPWFSKNSEQYSRNLQQLSNIDYLTSNTNIESKLQTCIEKIRAASSMNVIKKRFDPKNDWFDSKCENSRIKMLESLDRVRKSDSQADRQRYIELRSKHNKVCEEKKLNFAIANINKLNFVKNSSEWWKLANSLKKSPPRIGNSLSIDDFNIFFQALLHNTQACNDIQWCIRHNVDPFLDSPFELRELQLVLQNLKDGKAPGADRISYEFYKNAPLSYTTELLAIFNQIFLMERIPDSFLKSIIIPCFKKGDVNVVANYRGISLLDSVYKIFTGLLLNRLNSWLEYRGIINEFQAGFRKKYSTVDNLFNLMSIININLNDGKKTYAFFVDFSSAFDMIPRNALWYKLSTIGLSSKLVILLKKLYEGTSSQVWDGSSLSDPFIVSQGVKQGCLLSPLLFSIYLNDLSDALPCGITVGGTNIKVLMYADDIVLLSDSPDKLQQMIDALFIYCTNWGLKLNLNKSKIMVFRKSNRLSRNLCWKYGVEVIEVVNEYKYLGITLTFNLSFTKHLNSRLISSKSAINANWLSYIFNPKISITNKIKIFDSAAKSIMFYGAPVWGFRSYEEVEKLLRYFLKKILYLPMNTPNYMIHIETGMATMFYGTLDLHLSYIRKVFKLSFNRLPRLLAEETVRRNIFWFDDWKKLCVKFNINLDFTIWRNNLYDHHCNLLQAVRCFEKEKWESLAKLSRFHGVYSTLQYDITPYFKDTFSAYCISIIFKARGGLLLLNDRPFHDSSRICSICNLNEEESSSHVIGRCPIYSNIRLTFLNSRFLTTDEIFELLNGKDYMQLYNFLTQCLRYRSLIISEFA